MPASSRREPTRLPRLVCEQFVVLASDDANFSTVNRGISEIIILAADTVSQILTKPRDVAPF